MAADSDDKSNVTALPVKPKPRPEDDQDKPDLGNRPTSAVFGH